MHHAFIESTVMRLHQAIVSAVAASLTGCQYHNYVPVHLIIESAPNQVTPELVQNHLKYAETLYSELDLRFHIFKVDVVDYNTPLRLYDFADANPNVITIVYCDHVITDVDIFLGVGQFPWYSPPIILLNQYMGNDIILAHEIGHVFGLFHVNGDGLPDFVDDTEENDPYVAARNIMGFATAPKDQIEVTPGQLNRMRQVMKSHLSKVRKRR